MSAWVWAASSSDTLQVDYNNDDCGNHCKGDEEEGGKEDEEEDDDDDDDSGPVTGSMSQL